MSTIKLISKSGRETHIKIYPQIDTEDDIISRMAYFGKSLPEFIVLTEPVFLDDLNYNREVHCIDLYNDIVPVARENMQTCFNMLQEFSMLKQRGAGSPEKYDYTKAASEHFRAQISVLLNSSLSNQNDMMRIAILGSSPAYVVPSVVSQYNVSESSLRKSVTMFAVRSKRREKIYSYFFGSDKKPDHQEIEVSKAHFGVPFRIVNATDENANCGLNEFLDRLSLSDDIPVSGYKNVSKLFGISVHIPEEWYNYEEDTDDSLYMMVKTGTVEQELDYSTPKRILLAAYGRVLISSDSNGTLRMVLTTDISRSNRVKLFQKIFESIELASNERILYDEAVVNSGGQEFGLGGTYNIPQTRLNMVLFADMVMNDPYFGHFCNVDERKKASKFKNSIYLYIRFKNHIVPVNITPKKVELGDRSRPKNLSLFPENSRYARVKIVNVINNEMALMIQNIVSGLTKRYIEKEERYLKLYLRYIPDFKPSDNERRGGAVGRKSPNKKVAPKKVSKVKTPLDMSKHPGGYTGRQLREVSNLYPSSFGRKCIPKRVPILYLRDYYMEHKDEIDSKYPRVLESKDGKYFLVCDQDMQHRNISVIFTKDSYLPCCFTEGRGEKEYKKYLEMDENGPVEEKVEPAAAKKKLTTNKILEPGRKGELPGELGRMFTVSDPNAAYIRIGCQNTPSSMLEAMIRALGKIESDAAEYDIDGFRRKLFSGDDILSVLAPAKQFRPELSTEEIQNLLKSQNEIIHPLMYKSILEKLFNCGIILISRNEQDYFIETDKSSVLSYDIEYPRYVILYAHYGTETDMATRVQVEPILHQQYRSKVKITKNKIPIRKIDEASPETFIFDQKHPTIKRFKLLKRQLNQQWILNSPVQAPKFPFTESEKVKLISQHVDTFGMTRRLNFLVQSNLNQERLGDTPEQMITIHCSPVPPLFVPVSNEEYFLTVESKIKFTRAVFKELGFTANKQNFQTGDREIRATAEHRETRVQAEVRYVNVSDAINRYQKSERSARYLREVFVWFFSSYLHSKLSPNADYSPDFTLSKQTLVEMMNNFKERHIDYRINYRYNIRRALDLDSGNVIQNGKFVVSTDSIESGRKYVDKLVYHVAVLYLKNNRALLDAYKQKVIENYYLYRTDYKSRDYQQIFTGVEAFRTLKTYTRRLKLYTAPVKAYDFEPYFIHFKHPSGTGTSENWLCQPTSSLNEALVTIENWKETRINNRSPINRDPSVSDYILLSGVREDNSDEALPYDTIEYTGNNPESSNIVWKVDTVFATTPEVVIKEIYVALLKLE